MLECFMGTKFPVVAAWISSLAFAVTYADGADVKIVEAARSQVGVTVRYDPAYVSMEFPNGDVPEDRGVCTDVVVRALRKAHDFDLQKEVNADMKTNFSKYPKIWGLKTTDRNIDHRRVPNLQKFFERRGWKMEIPKDNTGWQAGDLVTCIVPPHLPHIMVVSDKKAADGSPLVIHNIGAGAREENRLKDFEITGAYRPVFGE